MLSQTTPDLESILELALAYWGDNKDSFLKGLKRFLSIPSISTMPQHRQDVLSAANFVADDLKAMGMHDVEIINGEDGEHPLVFAQWLGAPGKPTLLFYNHFDVQPVDPLNEWISPPFDAQVRNGKLYARGASDDKGQLYILLKALEGFFKTGEGLPINVKLLLEGEEESSGDHIARYVPANKDKLKADAAVILDTGMFVAGLPTITTGLRGIVCAEVICRGSATDLHSGQYGGAAPNAAEELAKILGKLKTDSGRIRIPGFYDKVARPTKLEMETWKKLPFDEKHFLNHEIGSPALTGDSRYSVLHRLFARPTLEINGMSGGFTGEGFKTVIPARATAKISMRIVPGMDPEEVGESFKRFVKSITPRCVTTEVKILSGSPAMVVDTGNTFISAAAEAFEQTFGVKTAYVREGASIPIASSFQSTLGLPVLITGFTLPDCNMHAPNESIDIGNFYAGIETVGRYMKLLAQAN